MAQTHKVLGQSSPVAATLTTLYTVPGSTQTICSTLSICNQASTAATYRVAVRPAGATVAAQHYLVYDSSIPANDTITLTLGLSLATTDIISIYASTNTLSFHAYGVEIT
jgi:hypothetical protein